MTLKTVYLRFENWSNFSGMLDQKGLPNKGIIIKVFPTLVNPIQKYNLRKNIKVIEVEGSSFGPEVYGYTNRIGWNGFSLDQYIDEKLPEDRDKKYYARALFRFSNMFGLGLCQVAMAAKKSDDSWLIDHPMMEIDGWETGELHLDVFFPSSIDALSTFLKTPITSDTTDNSGPILSFREARNIIVIDQKKE